MKYIAIVFLILAYPLSHAGDGYVFSRTDVDEYRYVVGNGNIWIDEACAISLGGASRSGTWVDLNAVAPNFDSIDNPCNGGNSGPDTNGYVFSRTDVDEYRYVVGAGNIWIDKNCAEQLGGPAMYGTWYELNSVAPEFDSIENPCKSHNDANSGNKDVNGFVFSRTDVDEYRYVVGSGNVWIEKECADKLGGATVHGTWFDLAAIAPEFDAIEKPCNGDNVIEGMKPKHGYVFSRTDANEFRYVLGNRNTWIDGECAARLGGATAFGTWFDLNEVAPNFDSIVFDPCDLDSYADDAETSSCHGEQGSDSGQIGVSNLFWEDNCYLRKDGPFSNSGYTLGVQNVLSCTGYYDRKIDGIYDSDTEQSVVNFQMSNGLYPSGVVDRNTWYLLQQLYTYESTSELFADGDRFWYTVVGCEGGLRGGRQFYWYQSTQHWEVRVRPPNLSPEIGASTLPYRFSIDPAFTE